MVPPDERLALPGPEEPEVRDQTSELSEDAAAAPADAAPADLNSDLRLLTSDATGFSPDQRREKRRLLDALRHDLREQILLVLADRGRANVGQIAARLGVEQRALSEHLSDLYNLDLLFNQRNGRNQDYWINPDRVLYQPQPDGRFTLTLLGRNREVFVTIGVPEARA